MEKQLILTEKAPRSRNSQAWKVGQLVFTGGCLGRADAAQGNVMSVEDRCHLRREVYFWEPPVERPGLGAVQT